MDFYFVIPNPVLNLVQDYSTIVSRSRFRINRNSIYWEIRTISLLLTTTAPLFNADFNLLPHRS
jgi:hypothetical protein